MKQETIGIVIPSIINDITKLQNTLAAVSSQTTLPDKIVLSIQGFRASVDDINKVKNIVEKDKNLVDITSIKVIDTKGPSTNRNNGLSHITTDIIIFLDDDTTLVGNAVEMVKQAYTDYPECAAITYRSLDESNCPRKKYPDTSCLRSKLSIMGVGAIEISARRNFLVDNQIMFDTNFGIAARFPIAEEAVFLSDILRRNGQVRYVPIDVAIHPMESTGSNYNPTMIKAYGSAIQRIFGIMSIIIIPVFIMKKKLSGHISNPLAALYNMVNGAISYLRISGKNV